MDNRSTFLFFLGANETNTLLSSKPKILLYICFFAKNSGGISALFRPRHKYPEINPHLIEYWDRRKPIITSNASICVMNWAGQFPNKKFRCLFFFFVRLFLCCFLRRWVKFRFFFSFFLFRGFFRKFRRRLSRSFYFSQFLSSGWWGT